MSEKHKQFKVSVLDLNFERCPCVLPDQLSLVLPIVEVQGFEMARYGCSFPSFELAGMLMYLVDCKT